MKRFLAILLSTLLFAIAGGASAAEPLLKGERQLSVALLEKMKAVSTALEKAGLKNEIKEDTDDKKNDLSADDIARTLDRDPRAKALLARHGMTSMEYAQGVVSLFPAAFYLMFEATMDKKGAAKLLASYPKERQANIELLRKNMQYLN